MPLESNHYFRQLAEGLPADALAQLGEALLALHNARTEGADDEAPAASAPAQRLRGAYLALGKAMLKTGRGQLNPVQQLFIYCGALADEVTLQLPSGEEKSIRLLDSSLYEGLLHEYQLSASALGAPDHAAPVTDDSAARLHAAQRDLLSRMDFLLLPSTRLIALADGELEPYDPEKAARHAAHPTQHGMKDGAALRRGLDRLIDGLRTDQHKAAEAARELVACLKAEKLGPALKESGDWIRLAALLIENASGGREKIAAMTEQISNVEASHTGELERLDRELQDKLQGLKRIVKEIRAAALQAKELTAELSGVAPTSSVKKFYGKGSRTYSDAELRRCLNDFEAVQRVNAACLVSGHRNSILGAGILVEEQLARLDHPLAHLVQPAALVESILKIDALHPNCFSHNSEGWPELPPVLVVPGIDIAAWLDDRFILGFIASDAARSGAQLELSPLDQAVLKLFGQYLSRGGIFNYRGERLKDSFMAEYSGDTEQKAVAKFTGQEKRLTYSSQSTEKDSASREDAVRDYCDFIFCVYNGLPLPKRISTRKAAILLKYCVIGTPEQTALLALRILPKEEAPQVKEIMLRLAGRDRVRLVELFEHAIDNDPQVRSRFRGDLRQAFHELMGREICDEVESLGLLSAGGTALPVASNPGVGAKPAEPATHSYFKL